MRALGCLEAPGFHGLCMVIKDKENTKISRKYPFRAWGFGVVGLCCRDDILFWPQALEPRA